MKRVREAIGMSQEEFSNLLGCSTASVSRWERRKTVPALTIWQFRRLLDMLSNFGYTIDDLYALAKQDPSTGDLV